MFFFLIVTSIQEASAKRSSGGKIEELSYFVNFCSYFGKYATNPFPNRNPEKPWFKAIKNKKETCDYVFEENWPNQTLSITEFNRRFESEGGLAHLNQKASISSIHAFQSYRGSDTHIYFKDFKTNFFGMSAKSEFANKFEVTSLLTSEITQYRSLFYMCLGNERDSGIDYKVLSKALYEVDSKMNFLLNYKPHPKHRLQTVNAAYISDKLGERGFKNACATAGRLVINSLDQLVILVKKNIESTNLYQQQCNSLKKNIKTIYQKLPGRIFTHRFGQKNKGKSAEFNFDIWKLDLGQGAFIKSSGIPFKNFTKTDANIEEQRNTSKTCMTLFLEQLDSSYRKYIEVKIDTQDLFEKGITDEKDKQRSNQLIK